MAAFARLRILLWREWRDVRAVALGCAALALLVSALMQHFVFAYKESRWSVAYLVPALTAVFAAIAASDLVSADAKARRLETLSGLPIGPGAAWTGKVVFLFLAMLGFALFSLLLQLVIPAAAGHTATAGETLEHITLALSGLYGAMVVGCAVLLFSTLALRSFVSALLGAGTVAAAAWFLSGVPWYAVGHGWVWLTIKGATPVVVLLAASRLAFVRGGVQWGARLRPALLSFGVIAAVAIPATVYANAKIHDFYNIDPQSEGLTVSRLQTSPNGRYVAMDIERNNVPGTSRVWVVRVEDGRLFTWAGAGQIGYGWTRDNLLSTSRPIGERSAWAPGRTRLLDPETGAVAREGTHSEIWAEVVHRHRDDPAWGQVGATGYTNVKKRYWINFTDSDEQVPVESWGRPKLLAGRAEIAFLEERDRLAWRNVETGESRLVAEGIAQRGWQLSPSREYVLVNLAQEARVIELSTGKTVWGPERKGFHNWPWAPTGIDLFVARGKQEDKSRLIDASTWRPVPLDPLGGRQYPGASAVWDFQPVAQGTTAAIRYGNEVILFDGQGQIVRTLFKSEAQR